MEAFLNPELQRQLALRTEELKNEREKNKTLKAEVSKGIEEILKVYAIQADLRRKLDAEEEKSNDLSTKMNDLKLSGANLREELQKCKNDLQQSKETNRALEDEAAQLRQSEGAKITKIGEMSETISNLRESNLRLPIMETKCKTLQHSVSSQLSGFRQIIAILADEVQNFDNTAVDPNSLEDGNSTYLRRLEEIYSNMENGLPDFQDDQEQRQRAENDLLQMNEILKGLLDHLSSKPGMKLATSSTSSSASATPTTSAGWTPTPGNSYRDAVQASTAIVASMSPWSVDSHVSNSTSLPLEPLVSSPSALPQLMNDSTASAQNSNENLNGIHSLSQTMGSDSQHPPLNANGLNEGNVLEEIEIPQRSKPSTSHANNANNLTFSPSSASAIEIAGGLPQLQNCQVRLETIKQENNMDETMFHGYAKSKSNPKESIFVCHCSQVFTSKTNVNAHFRQYKTILFTCNLCDKGFQQHYNLKRHIRRAHHMKCTGFVCNTCGNDFRTRQKLKAHKTGVHYIGRKKPQVDLTMPTPRYPSQEDQGPIPLPIYMEGLVDEHHFVQN